MTTISVIVDVTTAVSVILAIIGFFFNRERENRRATLEAYNILQREVLDELNMWR